MVAARRAHHRHTSIGGALQASMEPSASRLRNDGAAKEGKWAESERHSAARFETSMSEKSVNFAA